MHNRFLFTVVLYLYLDVVLGLFWTGNDCFTSSQIGKLRSISKAFVYCLVVNLISTLQCLSHAIVALMMHAFAFAFAFAT